MRYLDLPLNVHMWRRHLTAIRCRQRRVHRRTGFFSVAPGDYKSITAHQIYCRFGVPVRLSFGTAILWFLATIAIATLESTAAVPPFVTSHVRTSPVVRLDWHRLSSNSLCARWCSVSTRVAAHLQRVNPGSIRVVVVCVYARQVVCGAHRILLCLGRLWVGYGR